ncbi:uncharacterized protein TNCV_3566771 [Trichonephila clavipes]|nr:uncharacterized protein TNCV_3566771 [Trichonephila clavipes]
MEIVSNVRRPFSLLSEAFVRKNEIVPLLSPALSHQSRHLSLYVALSWEAEVMVIVLTVHADANVIAPYEQILGVLQIFDSCRDVISEPDLLWASETEIMEGLSDQVLKPSPCLHNGNEVDVWIGLDEWNSWFKSQVRDSNRSQDIMNLNKFEKFKKV